MNEYVAEIASLRSQLEHAKAEADYYKEMCGMDGHRRAVVARAFKLSPSVSAVVCLLASGRVISKYALFDAIPRVREGRDPKAVDVYIHRARNVFGSEQIKTVWGQGYVMEKDCADRVRAVMEPDRA
jgi:DNA-binding response OmpR family regulator